MPFRIIGEGLKRLQNITALYNNGLNYVFPRIIFNTKRYSGLQVNIEWGEPNFSILKRINFLNQTIRFGYDTKGNAHKLYKVFFILQ